MENGVAGWKVFDVKIAGVSLVMSYRESFAAEVLAGGIDGLIASLSDKNRRTLAGAAGAEVDHLAPMLILQLGAPRAR